jgi:hypothetical protein
MTMTTTKLTRKPRLEKLARRLASPSPPRDPIYGQWLPGPWRGSKALKELGYSAGDVPYFNDKHSARVTFFAVVRSTLRHVPKMSQPPSGRACKGDVIT